MFKMDISLGDKFFIYERILLFLCILILMLATFSKLISQDLFWHLNIGKSVFQGTLPFVDHFSFSFAGEKLQGTSWIFDSIAYAFSAISSRDFSVLGLQVFRGLCLTGTFLLFYVLFPRHWEPNLVRMLCIGVVAFALLQRPTIRPEIASYSLGLILVFLMIKNSGKMNLTALAVAGCIQLLWQNLHSGTAIFGWIILTGWYLQIGIDFIVEWTGSKQKLKQIFLVFLMGLGSLLTGFLSPASRHVLLKFLDKSHDWGLIITEYQTRGSTSDILFVVVLILSIVLQIRSKRIGYAFIHLISIFGLYKTHRVLPSVILYNLPLLIIGMVGTVPSLFGWKLLKWANWGMMLALLVSLILSVPRTVFNTGIKLNETLYPSTIMNVVNKKQLQGNCFAPLSSGGFISYFSGSRLKVFSDGRSNILFPYEFVTDAYFPACHHVESLEKIDRQYLIDYVICTLDESINPLIRIAFQSPNFHLNVVGENALLFSKSENSSFTQISNVLYREHIGFEQINTEALQEEYHHFKELLPDSPFCLLYELLIECKFSEDPRLLLQKQAYKIRRFPQFQYTPLTRLTLRLCDYFGLAQECLLILSSLPRTNIEDTFIGVKAFLLLAEYEEAQKKLDELNSILIKIPIIQLNDIQRKKMKYFTEISTSKKTNCLSSGKYPELQKNLEMIHFNSQIIQK